MLQTPFEMQGHRGLGHLEGRSMYARRTVNAHLRRTVFTHLRDVTGHMWQQRMWQGRHQRVNQEALVEKDDVLDVRVEVPQVVTRDLCLHMQVGGGSLDASMVCLMPSCVHLEAGICTLGITATTQSYTELCNAQCLPSDACKFSTGARSLLVYSG